MVNFSGNEGFGGKVEKLECINVIIKKMVFAYCVISMFAVLHCFMHVPFFQTHLNVVLYT